LDGFTLVVTGTLVARGKMTRDQFETLLVASGAELVESFNSSVKLVVRGDKPGKNKIEKALKSGIPVLTEQEFWAKYSK
jgi:NAD-dependent DNA ligase